ncbi:tRNA (adenosine(37)-N6)-threonylcarbamoyltransferase complex dimerization subunit type 1 TsaB [Acinetobacter qingfengensis]|uniref:tRNA threonylcarbamoyladenosine biosynthesis protein TsaB n=1 Tax=Acinetobacter qingfengensis TaxID=1262585 RepID=A0A1E7RFC0_9GAMM|nr:tRNA (adenosine(37)-N6)-threonylcarbamoyltransferase complex dimerization subunit type 1 TsaB [Acinetobacter qingfengensis]KAA8731856.1 tRNA (adenosine(37)-N6)-threonylcarbamoyltransferase complex dimerization subunit type 1 TsaB [Acinetobacter qingfengensis]OEY98021.1 tRNA (adenosine(37)-N6)-threonylcarbamoyltransferase complex dimerization subunit type 1 TsaB [Acinetobacter qingfengensis]
MYILALETANEQCSVAITDATKTLLIEQHHEARAQTQQILPMIQRAMQQTGLNWQQISAIAFSRGPGAFSGVRINAAVTQALAWANDLPVIAVSTLQALAQHAYREAGLTQVSAVIDARMNEVYLGNFTYTDGIMQAVTDEQLLDYTNASQHAIYHAVGTGAKLIHHDSDTKLCYANAQDIAEIARVEFSKGAVVSPEQALPVYLRDNAWKKISEQGKS